MTICSNEEVVEQGVRSGIPTVVSGQLHVTTVRRVSGCSARWLKSSYHLVDDKTQR